ncbi:MAG TPA: DUF3618 domain-containing protein [Acidimicrobiales bacterium]|jgi:ElaB/YqjD/DUF883 family membrane-anchored ribosome-binding protein|nr:DUF3618 domain-containing protein [Acidimicrobiales bacterium]
MGQTTDELRSQIAEQRDDLGRDLEAIGDRVSPGRMAQRRKAAVRERFTSAKEHVMGTAGDARDAVGSVPQSAKSTIEGNPLAVGLIAFGTGLVIATLLPETRPEQQLVEKMQPSLESAASEIGAAAKDTAEQLKPKVQDAANQLKDHAADAASHTTDQAKQATQEVRSQRT